MRRALVTGGAGFIGSHVVDALLARGTPVVVYDDFSTGREAHLPHHLPGAMLTIERGDVRDRGRLERAADGCDAVFHFQANADVRGGVANTRVDLEQNTIATWNVLDVARRVGATRFVFASSATVYGEPTVFPTPELFAGTQTSLYGASKLAGEAMCEAFASYYPMSAIVLRFSSLIGERYGHGVIIDLVRRLRDDPRQLMLLGDGRQEKSYLHVGDAIDALWLALSATTHGTMRINLAHDTTIAVRALAEIVIDEMGLHDVQIVAGTELRGWAGDSPRVELSLDRARALGWAPRVSIEEGIRRTVRYLLANDVLRLADTRGPVVLSAADECPA